LKYNFLKKQRLKKGKWHFLSDYSQMGNPKKELLIAYQDIWSRDNLEYKDETNFTEVFLTHIDQAVEKNDFDFLQNIFQIYISNIGKRRDGYSLANILQKIFETNSKERSWRKQAQFKETFKLNPDFWRTSFSEIMKHMLQRDCYLFFETTKKYFNDIQSELNLDKESDIKDKHYLQNYLKTFFQALCHVLKKDNSFWEIHNFPEEWMITSENLQNIENRIARQLYIFFFNWIQNFKQWNKEEITEENIKNVFSLLFPGIDSSFFPSLLLFITHYNENDPRSAQKIIELGQVFNIVSKIRSYSHPINLSQEESDKQRNDFYKVQKDEEKEESLRLTTIVLDYFKTPNQHLFHPNNFPAVLKNFKAVKAKDDCEKYYKKNMIEVLTNIEKRLREKGVIDSRKKD